MMTPFFAWAQRKDPVMSDCPTGWMVPALSPVRWLWGYMLTAEVPAKRAAQYATNAFNFERPWQVPNLTPLTLQGATGSLLNKARELYRTSGKRCLQPRASAGL